MKCATTAQDAYGKVPARELAPRAEFAEPPRAGRNPPDHRAPRCARCRCSCASIACRSYAEAAPGQAEALETLAQLLGGDQTALLYRELVVEKKLATDAGASYDGYARDAGEFTRLCRAAPRRVAGDAGTGGRPGARRRHARPHRQRATTSRAPRPSWSPASPIAATASSRWRPPMARRLPSA